MDTMTAVEAWSLILGIASPFLVSLVNNPDWKPLYKRIASVVIALAVGIINLLVNDRLDFGAGVSMDTIIINLALVLGAAQAAYHLLWKPTGAPQKLEHRTSKQKTPGGRA